MRLGCIDSEQGYCKTGQVGSRRARTPRRENRVSRAWSSRQRQRVLSTASRAYTHYDQLLFIAQLSYLSRQFSEHGYQDATGLRCGCRRLKEEGEDEFEAFRHRKQEEREQGGECG